MATDPGAVFGRLRSRWHLRRCLSVGPRAVVEGSPEITCPNVTVGSDFRVEASVAPTYLFGHGRIDIGDRVWLRSGVWLYSIGGVTIGDDVVLSYDVRVLDDDSHGIGLTPARFAPVTIEDGAFVGARAMITAGVRVGARSFVAAGSVVRDDVPEQSLVAGVPARVIRTFELPDGCMRSWHRPDGACPLPWICPAAASAPPVGRTPAP
jgi:maltose O-acetyltransferase